MTTDDKQRIEYMLQEAKELALPYNDQLSNAEEFILWNLPDEIGLDWIAAREMEIINNLEQSKVLPQCTIDKMNYIVDQFENAFDVPMDEVFSHNAMKNSKFWAELREIATELVVELQRTLM